MKALFIFATMMALTCINTFAQEIPEPEFVGEVVAILPDGNTTNLEKEQVVTRTRANAGALIAGIGKVKTKIVIESPSASVRLKPTDEIKLIVKAVDNQGDPLSIIKIFSFDVTKTKRLAEIASMSTFGSMKNNKLEYLRFSAEKYGNQSYLITLKDKPKGEYGITVSNPNQKDEKEIIVSTFAIE